MYVCLDLNNAYDTWTNFDRPTFDTFHLEMSMNMFRNPSYDILRPKMDLSSLGG